MSTHVIPEDYPTLTEVPRENWTTIMGPTIGFCDLEPSHGRAVMFLQTPDKRAIALCDDCYRKVAN